MEDIDRVVVYSRNETEHFNMSQEVDSSKIQYVIGDVKDYNILFNSLINIDYVFHTAAIKHIDMAEANPIETTQVNVIGTLNLINASIQNKVDKVFFVSTDKACLPTGAYGVSKLMGEKNIILSNKISDTKFSAVRFGNIIGSNGSIFQKWGRLVKDGHRIQVTDKSMTRFFIEKERAAHLCIKFMSEMNGGELFIPKMKSAKILDLALSITQESNIDVVGLRPAEKINEDIISELDLGTIKELDDYYIIFNDKAVNNFTYNSEKNELWFSSEEIKDFFK